MRETSSILKLCSQLSIGVWHVRRSFQIFKRRNSTSFNRKTVAFANMVIIYRSGSGKSGRFVAAINVPLMKTMSAHDNVASNGAGDPLLAISHEGILVQTVSLVRLLWYGTLPHVDLIRRESCKVEFAAAHTL